MNFISRCSIPGILGTSETPKLAATKLATVTISSPSKRILGRIEATSKICSVLVRKPYIGFKVINGSLATSVIFIELR